LRILDKLACRGIFSDIQRQGGGLTAVFLDSGGDVLGQIDLQVSQYHSGTPPCQ